MFEGEKHVKSSMPISIDDEWTETEWLHLAAHNPAFDFLADSADDIYSVNDGKRIEAANHCRTTS